MERFRIILLASTALWLSTSAAQQGTKPVITPAPVTNPTADMPKPGVAPTGPAHVSSTYVLGEDDSIRVDVWKEPSLSGNLTIRPDGRISLPLVGDMTAAGLTPMMLGDEITKRLKQYVNDPLVTVTVNQVNSKRIYLLGEVGHVGPLALTEDMTILQAISTAGGLTPYAKKKGIYILRGPEGHQVKIPFDYNKAAKKGDLQGVTLMPGDIIYVP